MIGRFLALAVVAGLVAILVGSDGAGGLGVSVIDAGIAARAEPLTAGAKPAAAVNSYQVKFSYEKSDGNRAITTTVVQAKSTTEAQRQVKASYHKVNIITIKKL